MDSEIYNLLADNKKLPEGTLIDTRWNGTQPLSEIALESANEVPNLFSDHVPFWIIGWKDLHDRLHLPKK